MRVLYVSFGSKVGPTSFDCATRLLLYSIGSGVNRM